MKTRWRILGTLTTTSPLHIGSGETIPLKLNKDDPEKKISIEVQAIEKDYLKRPCIPGSALKGVLRAWAEGHFGGEKLIIDRLFGSRRMDDSSSAAGCAEFCVAAYQGQSACDYARWVPHWNSTSQTVPSLTGISSHVCIDPQTGAAQQGKLFYEEFVPEGITFSVEIDATLLEPDEINFLLHILEAGADHASHPYQFGANGTDGWGRMAWKLTSVQKCEAARPQGIGFDCCTVPYLPGPWKGAAAEVPPHISVELELAFQGPFLVNDASRAKQEKDTDTAENSEDRSRRLDLPAHLVPLRRASGEFWLPASSFRGALRSRFEFLLKSLNPQDKNGVDRVFGGTSQSSRLKIEEFSQVDREKNSKPSRQDFVAIDRFLGGAANSAKFEADYADRPVFKTRLTLDLSILPENKKTNLRREDVALLAAALRDVCQGKVTFGWKGSAGYGEARGTVNHLKAVDVDPGWKVPTSLMQGKLDEYGKVWLKESLGTLLVSPTGSPPAAVAAQPTAPAANPVTLSVPSPSKAAPSKLATRKPYVLKQGVLKREGHRQVLEIPPTKYSPGAGTIRPDLRASTEASIQVEVEMEGGQPARIYPIGESWEMPAAPNPPVSTADRFANPYYFLRMKDRENFQRDLADKSPLEPVRHECYLPGHFSGTIRVRVTTKTPLLICDEGKKTDIKDHFQYGVLREPGGDLPLLPSSSVRGMLRSAYEAVTNSRFGVFPGTEGTPTKPAKRHGRRLGFRLPANSGLNTVPVRIIDNGGQLAAEVLAGASTVNTNGGKNSAEPVFAAWCGFYNSWKPTLPGGNFHKAIVWAYLTLWHYHRPSKSPTGNPTDFDFWNVEALEAGANPKPTVLPLNKRKSTAHIQPHTASSPLQGWHKGYLCITQQNMTGKHDERFFFSTGAQKIPPIDLTPENYLQWRQLIENYHDQHSRDLVNGSTRPPIFKSKKDIVYSRHISTSPPNLSTLECELHKDDLLYAEIEQIGTAWIVKGLYPVMISRKLYPKSPLDLLPKSLRPAKDINELSPADRVFGWVSQAESADQREYPAYRSLVRVGPVACTSSVADSIEVFDPPKTLAILAEPKPQQGRFYLGDKFNRGSAQLKGLTKEQSGYHDDNRIRGPKVYPHHAEGVVENIAFTQKRENQNRSITGQVKPGATFEFDLHLTNLSELELGALVWLLSLPDDHYLRLGLGKPLGFGSVRLEIVESGSRIADGSDWTAAIAHWNNPPAPCSLTPCQNSFEEAIQAANPGLLEAFRIAAKGFDKVPIHYPLTMNQYLQNGHPPQNCEHFLWFEINERGQKDVLPDLTPDNLSNGNIFLTRHKES